MADNSFDIVSKIDRQEADNALNQASKELSQRFDFKNTETEIKWLNELSVERPLFRLTGLLSGSFSEELP